MPEVSVIIPVYNVEQYLTRCLESVLNQTYADYEVICINDCSMDKSEDILNTYAKKYPSKLTVLVNEQNMGLGRTRERGIKHARGEYILFVDSDDYIRNDFVEVYIKEMRKCLCDVIIGGYTRDVDGKLTEHKVSDSVWSVVTYPIACAKMFRKNFIVENNIEFSDIRCGEDIYFSLCIFFYGVTFHVIDYNGYYYYFNRNSITGSMNYNKNHEKFIAHIFARFLSKHDIHTLTIEKQQIIEYTYIANMVNALITYGHGGKIKRMKKKYEFFIEDLQRNFPCYKRNPYFGFFKPKGQTRKIRLGVGSMMLLHRVHLDRLLLYVVSLI